MDPLREPDHPAPELVHRMVRLGMAPEAAAAAVRDDRVMLALLQHLTVGPASHSLEEAASRSGLEPDTIRALDRAMGMGSPRSYTDLDVRYFALARTFFRLFPSQELLRVARGESQALQAVARQTLQFGNHLVFEQFHDDDPVDAAVGIHKVTGPLLRMEGELISLAYQRIVLDMLTSDLAAEAARSGGDVMTVAVGFADLVGYTSLSASVAPHGLSQVLDDFERRARDGTVDGVTLVKFLGDAAMYVAQDPVALAQTLWELTQRERDDAPDRTPIRAGMAWGPTLLRGGDFFGETVNEAARLTEQARPWSTLVAQDAVAAVDHAFVLKGLEPLHLHGLGVRHPVALREPREATAA